MGADLRVLAKLSSAMSNSSSSPSAYRQRRGRSESQESGPSSSSSDQFVRPEVREGTDECVGSRESAVGDHAYISDGLCGY